MHIVARQQQMWGAGPVNLLISAMQDLLSAQQHVDTDLSAAEYVVSFAESSARVCVVSEKL